MSRRSKAVVPLRERDPDSLCPWWWFRREILGISRMADWRRRQRAEVALPPLIKIGNLNYITVRSGIAYLDALAAQSSEPAAMPDSLQRARAAHARKCKRVRVRTEPVESTEL